MRSKKKPGPLDESALYDYAIKMLGRRMRTVAELKHLMQPKVEASESGQVKVASVLNRLQQRHYLDDTNYAATYTRLRQENEKFGRRRVAQELSRKGVNSTLIRDALEQGYENLSEEELARKHLARKRIKPPTNDKESSRIVRLLLRAGFSTGVIFKVFKEWQISDKTLATLETIEPEDQESL